MMKKAIESGFKFTATKEGRKQARELFRKAYRKFKYHKQSGQRVKDKGFIHSDIKPPNILYNINSKRYFIITKKNYRT